MGVGRSWPESPALVRLPPPHPHHAAGAPAAEHPERAVVARPGGRVGQRLVRPPDLQERLGTPAAAGGDVGVEALGHGAVRGPDLHLRRRAAHAQRFVERARRRPRRGHHRRRQRHC
uniref:Uncharacterized protein n=1 Tax=Triticum urartu TaxID=4572 RepID=A0A8R7R168_TRIUA